MPTRSVDVYGPKQPSLPAHDVTFYAQTLAWHSKETDPTGLIWLGKRYYNPQTGRFLSPDPVGGFACIDMYGYVAGDPINFYDLDGRWKSDLYSVIRGTTDSVAHTIADISTFSLDILTKLAFAEEFIDAAVENREINPHIASFMEMGCYSGGIKEGYNFTTRKILSPPTNLDVYEKTYDIADWAALGLQLMRGNVKKLTQIKSVKKYDLNRINHIFGIKSIKKHNLEGFLNKFSGDQIQAFASIEKAVQNLAKKGKISGIFKTTVKIKGSKLVVQGKVINGTTKIGTVFIP
ncbi:MAG: RHS repeat-associated core domain-containing protein [Chlamydiota bacterium]